MPSRVAVWGFPHSRYNRTMPDFTDIMETAAQWYAVKIAKGETPQTIHGGHLDGVLYFEIDMDGRRYWITKRGLFDPPPEEA